MPTPHRSVCRALRSDLRTPAVRPALLALGLIASALVASGCGPSSAAKTAEYPLPPAAAELPANDPLYRSTYLAYALYGEKDAKTGARTSTGYFGTPAEPTLWNMSADEDSPAIIGGDPRTGHTAHLQIGRDLFRKHCLHCHGIWGMGNGSTAEWLQPRPRNFWNGRFKFKSTDGPKPTRDDLIRTIRQGAHGTYMPAFKILEDPQLGAHAAAVTNGDERMERALRPEMADVAEGHGHGDSTKPFWTETQPKVIEYLADYVIHLAIMGEVGKLSAIDTKAATAADAAAMGQRINEIVRENYELVRDRWVGADKRVVNPTTRRPGVNADGSYDWAAMYASVKTGRDLFLSTKWQCTQCHGQDATGRAPQPDLVASWQKTFDAGDGWESFPQPANLTLGWYHRGGRPIDLWRQLTLGIDPMPAFAGPEFPESERWHLVNYIRAVPYWGAELERTPADVKAAGEKAGGH